jgi:hypothetical protein
MWAVLGKSENYLPGKMSQGKKGVQWDRSVGLELIKYLLDSGADPNLCDVAGNTPLISAARIGFLEAVHLILDRGVKFNHKNDSGLTALNVAEQSAHHEIVQILKRFGAE